VLLVVVVVVVVVIIIIRVFIVMQTSSSGSGSTSNADSPQCSDLYFDDEFASERIMSRDRHLRLQTTLGLDRTASTNLFDEFRSPVVVSGRAVTQRKKAGHRAAAGDTAAGRQKMKLAREGAASFGEGNLRRCQTRWFLLTVLTSTSYR